MPRSIPTIRLTQAAHALGDDYYRCISAVSRAENESLEKCVSLGRSYMDALEALRKHLRTLPFDAEVETLIRNTDDHLKLIRQDLKRHQTLGH